MLCILQKQIEKMWVDQYNGLFYFTGKDVMGTGNGKASGQIWEYIWVKSKCGEKVS